MIILSNNKLKNKSIDKLNCFECKDGHKSSNHCYNNWFGYLFSKYIFFSNEYESLNFNKITKSYPNLTYIL